MPFSSEEVELLLQIARDAGLGSSFRERIDSFAEALRALIPFSTISAFVTDLRGGGGPANGHLVFYDRDPAALAEYATHYRFIDPMGVSFPEGKGVPYLLSDFPGGRAFGKDAFSSDYLPRIGVRHIMALGHHMPDGQMFALAIHRERGLRDFTRHERELARLASPDIGRAIHGVLLNEKVAALSSQAGGETAGSGAMVFGPTGELRHADAGAVALGRLMDAAGLLPEALLPDVRGLLRAGPGRDLLERIYRLPEGWLRVRHSRLGTGRARSVITLLELLAAGSPEHFQAIAERARLTPREREVVALVVQGLGNRHIAHKLGVSPVTVGVHLTKIYEKTGTTGRNELTALFLGNPEGGAPR